MPLLVEDRFHASVPRYMENGEEKEVYFIMKNRTRKSRLFTSAEKGVVAPAGSKTLSMSGSVFMTGDEI